MSEDQQKYRICRYLNVELRVMTLTLDEIIPIGFLLFMGLVIGHFAMMLIAAALCFLGIRKLKKGRGQGVLMSLLYWYSDDLGKLLFRKFPPASKRYWF